jgi:hypothetical protein
MNNDYRTTLTICATIIVCVALMSKCTQNTGLL